MSTAEFKIRASINYKNNDPKKHIEAWMQTAERDHWYSNGRNRRPRYKENKIKNK